MKIEYKDIKYVLESKELSDRHGSWDSGGKNFMWLFAESVGRSREDKDLWAAVSKLIGAPESEHWSGWAVANLRDAEGLREALRKTSLYQGEWLYEAPPNHHA